MPNRPQPAFPEQDTEYFWQGCKENELRYQKDSAGNVIFYPRAHSTVTGEGDLTWHVSEGLGTVYTYSVAYIDLDEGFRMLSSVVGVDDPTTDITVGMREKVEFEVQEEGEYPIPVFRPVV